MCRTTNRPASLAEPEVWFRIVHVAVDAPDGAPVASYREQKVEIALGPKGAFENGNVGTLTREVPAERIVKAVPPRRGKPRPPKAARTPRVVEILRKAQAWRELIESGEVRNQAEIARREGVTRARVTQIMGLLRLAPEIQEKILDMPEVLGRSAVTERTMRPITGLGEHADQVRLFTALVADG